MNRILLTLLLAGSLLSTNAQSGLKTLKPTETFPLEFDMKVEKELQRLSELQSREKRSEAEEKELNALQARHDGSQESVWDVLGLECSWYCGGGNYAVKASSALPDTNAIRYKAESANDFNYRTAWVEGKPGEGKGEYLEYLFKNESPRVTHVIIANGYVKSEAAWRDNNRVKKLKMYVNGKPYAILYLEDSRSSQTFEVGLLGRNKNGKDLVLRFEIMEVYKGDKYNDTAITEIHFDGTDVH
jgi:hypothetical protein